MGRGGRGGKGEGGKGMVGAGGGERVEKGEGGLELDIRPGTREFEFLDTPLDARAITPTADHSRSSCILTRITSYIPGGGETICPPPMAVRLAADLRPSADGSAVRTSLVAGQLQAASVQIA